MRSIHLVSIPIMLLASLAAASCSSAPLSETSARAVVNALASAPPLTAPLASPPGQDMVSPVAVSTAPGTLDVFALGAIDSRLYRKQWLGSSWSPALDTPWEMVGGRVSGVPAIVANGAHAIDVFAVGGGSGGIFHKAWDGRSWLPSAGLDDWDALGGQFVGSPAAAVGAGGRMEIVAVGADGHLYRREWDGSAWQPFNVWQLVGGRIVGSPAIVATGPSQFDVYVVGADDGALYHKRLANGAWSPIGLDEWDRSAGRYSGTPSAVVTEDGITHVVVTGYEDGSLYDLDFAPGALAPSITGLGGHVAGSPHATTWGGTRLDVIVTGADDGATYHKAWDGAQWVPSVTAWDRLGGQVLGSPTAVSWGPQRYDLFVAGAADGAIFHKRWDAVNRWWPSANGDAFERMGSLAPTTPKQAPWLVLLCKYADHDEEWQSREVFNQLFSSAGAGTQNLADYWNGVSDGLADVSGTVVSSGWAKMPTTFPSYYAHFCGVGDDIVAVEQKMINDCVDASGMRIQLPSYSAVLAVFNYGGVFQGQRMDFDIGYGLKATRGAVALGPGVLPCNGGPATTPPTAPLGDATQIGHEMGHGFGLTHAHSLHFADALAPNAYAGNWNDEYGHGYDDEYGDGWDDMGGAQQGFLTAGYGMIGPGLNAAHLTTLGWMEPSKRYTYPGGTQVVQLTALNHPENAGYRMARIAINGNPQHQYVIELRAPSGWDRGLGVWGPPGTAVLIHEIDPMNESVLRFKDATHGQFEPGDVFSDPAANVTITVQAIANANDPAHATATVQIAPAR